MKYTQTPVWTNAPLPASGGPADLVADDRHSDGNTTDVFVVMRDREGLQLSARSWDRAADKSD